MSKHGAGKKRRASCTASEDFWKFVIADRNGFAESLIGSIRRRLLYYVLGAAHLRRILGEYAAYYNERSP
jgi:hypothetical protein